MPSKKKPAAPSTRGQRSIVASAKTKTQPKAPPKAQPAPHPRVEAPRMIVQGYRHFGGLHHETAHLKNIFEFLGLTSPHTGKPFTEAMLLGIGGGVGAGYVLYEICGETWLVLGARHLWQSLKADFISGICQRLGARTMIKEAGGRRPAEANLHESLAAGRPAICWVAMAGLPYHCLPIEWLKGFVHSVVIYGLDEKEKRYLIADRSRVPLRASVEEVTVARGAIGSLMNRTMAIDPPAKPADLAKAIRDGIRSCAQSMTKPANAMYGLSSLKRWADLVTNVKDKKGWPSVLDSGPRVRGTLARVHASIEVDGTGGGAFRTLYAEFLDEARVILDKPSLTDAAAAYRASAAEWSGMAEAALPSSVPELKEIRELQVAKARLFEEKGEAAMAEMTAIESRLKDLKRGAGDEMPMPKDDLSSLFSGLGARIGRIAAIEEEAVKALQASLV